MPLESLIPFIQTYSFRVWETENSSFDRGSTPLLISTTTQFTGILMLLCKWKFDQLKSIWWKLIPIRTWCDLDDFRWYIDSIPIRIFRNYENAPKQKTAFPNKQGMRLYTSLWNAQDWATQGGRVKTNWASAPFTASFRRFRPRACPWNGEVSISQCASNSPTNWWTSAIHAQLSASQSTKLQEIREKYMIYDYCLDPTRRRSNGVLPPECYRRPFKHKHKHYYQQ